MRRLSHADVIAMFERVGEIVLRTEASLTNPGPDQKPFNWLIPDAHPTNDGACVYLWVEEKPDCAPVVLYIGKAGSTLVRRCRQHAAGFRGVNRGKAHADDLIKKIKGGSTIGIYGLWPAPMRFMGEMIPSHSSIEDWLIAVTKPKPARNR